MGVVSLDLPEDVDRRLQQLADRTGRNQASCMVEGVQEYLDDQEDLHIAEQRLNDLRTGQSGTVPLNEAM